MRSGAAAARAWQRDALVWSLVAGMLVLTGAVNVWFLAAPSGKLPASMQQILVVLVAAVVVALSALSSSGPAVVSLPGVALVAWTLASLRWTVDPGLTLFFLRRDMLAFVVFLVGFMHLDTDEVARLFRRLGTSTVVIAVVNIVLLPRARTSGSGPSGFGAGYTHKNIFGIALVFAFAMILAFVVRHRMWWIVATIALVVLTRSATAAAGIVTTGAAWSIARAIDEAQSLAEALMRRLAALAALALSPLLALGLLPVFLDLYDKDVTYSGRTYIWAASWHAALRRPWQGYGYQGLWFDQAESVTFRMNREIGFAAGHAHSGVLEVVLELGIIGLALFLVVMFAMWRHSRHQPIVSGFVIALLAGTAVVAISESNLISTGWIFFWIGSCWAITSASVRAKSERAPLPVPLPAPLPVRSVPVAVGRSSREERDGIDR